MMDRLTEANPFVYGDSATNHHTGVTKRTSTTGAMEEAEFGAPSLMSAWYRKFLDGLHAMADHKDLPFTLIISDPLSNSFVVPVPTDTTSLLLRVEKEDSWDCYDSYVYEGMEVEEYERSHD